MINFTF